MSKNFPRLLVGLTIKYKDWSFVLYSAALVIASVDHVTARPGNYMIHNRWDLVCFNGCSAVATDIVTSHSQTPDSVLVDNRWCDVEAGFFSGLCGFAHRIVVPRLLRADHITVRQCDDLDRASHYRILDLKARDLISDPTLPIAEWGLFVWMKCV